MMNRRLWGWVWIKWEDCLYSSAVYTTNVLGTTLDNSASMLGPWNVRLHGKLNIVSILGYRYIFMSTEHWAQQSGENVRYWCFYRLEKKLRKTSERAGAGVWLPPPSYVRTSEGYYVKIWGRQLPIRFNFWSKNQLRKTEKYRILIKDLISNKWKCKAKEAGLILQSGIYIYLLH